MAARRLRLFAFFRELGFVAGENVSAADFERAPCPDKASVVRYLNSGTPLVVVPGYANDPLDELNEPMLSGGTVLTDGEWAWPRIAVTLVGRHDIAVPNAFLLHMGTAGFVAPELSIRDVRIAFERSRRDLLVM